MAQSAPHELLPDLLKIAESLGDQAPLMEGGLIARADADAGLLASLRGKGLLKNVNPAEAYIRRRLALAGAMDEPQGWVLDGRGGFSGGRQLLAGGVRRGVWRGVARIRCAAGDRSKRLA